MILKSPFLLANKPRHVNGPKRHGGLSTDANGFPYVRDVTGSGGDKTAACQDGRVTADGASLGGHRRAVSGNFQLGHLEMQG